MFVLFKKQQTGNVLKNRWAGRLMFHSLCSDDKSEIDPRCYIFPLSFCLVMVELLLFLFFFCPARATIFSGSYIFSSSDFWRSAQSYCLGHCWEKLVAGGGGLLIYYFLFDLCCFQARVLFGLAGSSSIKWWLANINRWLEVLADHQFNSSSSSSSHHLAWIAGRVVAVASQESFPTWTWAI